MNTNTSTESVYISIDIGKNVNAYGVYVGIGLDVASPVKEVHSTRIGLEKIKKTINAQLKKSNQIVVGFEPTGIYHEPWIYALKQSFGNKISLRQINPYQVKQERKKLLNGAYKKTDPIDVLAIAHCLRDNLGNPVHLSNTHEISFQLWVAEYHQIQKRKQKLHNSLRMQFDRLWPGALVNVHRFERAHPTMKPPSPLVLSRPFERKLLKIMLENRPDPHDWESLSLSDIQTFFRQHGLRCGPQTAEKVSKVVNQAVFLPKHITKQLAERIQSDFELYQRENKRLEALKIRAEELVPHTDAKFLFSLPGISYFLSAQYLAYVIDTERFDNAGEVWSFAGFDPGQNDSGDRRKTGKISRRGNPGFRDTLYRMGLNMSLHCSAIARAKKRALRNGKGPVGATIHAAHKVNRIGFYLLKNKVFFDRKKLR